MQGVLRSVLAGGITTQVSKCRAHVASLTACPFCWQEPETIEHLFWSCPMWQQVRLSFLSPQQLRACIDLPLCTRRTGIFPLSAEQADAMSRIHTDPCLHPKPEALSPSPCNFAEAVHHMMIAVVKARNGADELPMPDDFAPRPFLPPPKKKGRNNPMPSSSPDVNSDDKLGKPAFSSPPSDNPAPLPPRATHDEECLLLSTSLRPGGSKYQYVQFNEKKGRYKAVVPHGAKRHTIGLFDTDAARAVKSFFDALQHGQAPMTRGEKRTSKCNSDLEPKLASLNTTAKADCRHFVESSADPTCRWCKKSVGRFYALKFAESLCPELTCKVDKAGSATRVANLSKTRLEKLKTDVDAHNKQARASGQHFIADFDNPFCQYCKDSVTVQKLRRWMTQHCPAAPKPIPTSKKKPLKSNARR